MIQGLNFLHRRSIAHWYDTVLQHHSRDSTHTQIVVPSDCSMHNIMTETNSPTNGQKNLKGSTLSDSTQKLSGLSDPVTFYLIAFRSARHCDPCDKMFESERFARDPEPPEFRSESGSYYDPLLLDIFLIGNMLRRIFLDVSIPSLSISLLSQPMLYRNTQILTS